MMRLNINLNTVLILAAAAYALYRFRTVNLDPTDSDNAINRAVEDALGVEDDSSLGSDIYDWLNPGQGELWKGQ